MDTSKRRVCHSREEETLEAKARWFQSLSLQERMELFCEVTEMALAADPHLPERRHARSISGRIRILRLPQD